MDWLVSSAHAAQAGLVEVGVKAIDWITWVWVVVLSSAGGGVSFYNKLKLGHARPFNVAELVGELGVSAFVGLVTFFLCKGADLNEFLTAGLVGLTGHMGTRALMRLEAWAERKFHLNDK